MANVNLLVKTSSASQLKKIEQLLMSEFENLGVEIKFLGCIVGNWVQVSISGEDETIATNYISKEFGVCPKKIENVTASSTYKGYITEPAKEKDTLLVDIGVFEPKIIQAKISLAHLQTQLVDGKKLSLKEIAELYGFSKGLPLNVKITCLDEGKGFMQAELSLDDTGRLHLWQESLLDRLIVLGSSLDEVEVVVERARLGRDVIGVESFGLFEHVLTCKLGTDAAGLIPRIGRYLRNARFVVFNPRKVFKIVS